MKLSIALAAAAVILRFTTPGPGSWYVFEHDRDLHVTIVASGYTTNSCHVSYRILMGQDFGLYNTAFVPDEE